MSKLMLEYIREQKALTLRMLEERAEITAPFMEAFGALRPARVVLLGSGSSFYAGQMARPALEALLGVEVTVTPPTLAPPLALLDMEKTLFIAASQGGSSSSTVELIREIRAAGGRVAAITGSEDTIAGKESNTNQVLRIGEEKLGPKTKGVLASILTLILTGMDWGRALGTASAALCEELAAGMRASADLLPENIERTLSWCKRVMPALAPREHIAILAEGNDLSAGQECAMKLLETICRPVIAYEFEEYLHGCFCMLNDKSTMLFLLPRAAEEQKRFYALREYSEKHGAQCYFVSRGGTAPREADLALETAGNDLLSFFEYLLPGQVLSAELSAFVGIDIEAGVLRDFQTEVPFHEGDPRPWEQS